MEKYPVYDNPYDQCSVTPSTVIGLHRFDIVDSELKRFIPNLSPFPLKLEAYLRFFGINYTTILEPNLDAAPRHKIPFITVDGVTISDSDLIINFLKTKFSNPDSILTPKQITVGHLVQRTLEDHFYWIILYYEFFDDAGSTFFFKATRGGQSAVTEAIRDDYVARVYNQGTGRYTPQEIIEKAKNDLLAVSQILGDSEFVLGTEKPTSFDAVVFGMLSAIFQARDLHPEITDVARSISNLSLYMKRLLAEYFTELEAAF
ncbi:putative glutathione S-transferase [Xylogone sp. PMI_703]|nr:putative glutathione S-transferase [Xylogone sp. PMI_703]